jgi:hypothetical protein
MKATVNKIIGIDHIDKEVTELRIFERKIEDVNFLKDFRKIENLYLGYIKTENLNFIKNLNTIEKLVLYGVNSIQDISPIADLENLKELEMTTIAGWDGSGKKIHYETLQPLTNLKKLESLKTIDIEFSQDGLSPLIPVKSLKHFITRNSFTTSDFALLERYRPDIKCEYAHAYRVREGNEYYKCKKCGAYKVEFSGKDLSRRVFCLNCNEKKVNELTKRYIEIQQNT